MSLPAIVIRCPHCQERLKDCICYQNAGEFNPNYEPIPQVNSIITIKGWICPVCRCGISPWIPKCDCAMGYVEREGNAPTTKDTTSK